MSDVELDLAGKVAVVTGAGRGVGRHLALTLGAAGASVAAVGRSHTHLDAVVADIAAAGGRAHSFPADVTAPNSATDVLAAVAERFGETDVLVNNAGTMQIGQVESIDPDRWWSDFEVNIRAPMVWTQAALPAMRRKGSGTIVNVTSAAAGWVVPACSAYIASKAALDRFTAVLQAELEGSGVLVFSFGPRVSTDMTYNLGVAPAFTEKQRALFAGGHLSNQEEKLQGTLHLFRRLLSGELDHLAGGILESGDPPA